MNDIMTIETKQVLEKVLDYYTDVRTFSVKIAEGPTHSFLLIHVPGAKMTDLQKWVKSLNFETPILFDSGYGTTKYNSAESCSTNIERGCVIRSALLEEVLILLKNNGLFKVIVWKIFDSFAPSNNIRSTYFCNKEINELVQNFDGLIEKYSEEEVLDMHILFNVPLESLLAEET